MSRRKAGAIVGVTAFRHDAMRRIVVGIDGSPGATEALRFALEEADVSGASVTAVTAWDVPPGGTAGPGRLCWPTSSSRKEVRTISSGVWSPRVQPSPASRWSRASSSGDARRVLCHAAVSADMLVLGSRGLGTVKSLLLGSVGMYCVHHAPCPVVIVPPRRGDGEQASLWCCVRDAGKPNFGRCNSRCLTAGEAAR